MKDNLAEALETMKALYTKKRAIAYKKPNGKERAKIHKKPNSLERAIVKEKTI